MQKKGKAAAGQPEIFDSPYTGMGSSSGGVVGMIEVIQSDFERLGLVRFVAFVWLSESRAKAQFEALSEHFAATDTEGLGDTLHHLFEEVGSDEQFHASYSRALHG